MKLWLATALAAMLLSACTAYPYYAKSDVTPDASMEQMDDTTPDMEEDYPTDVAPDMGAQAEDYPSDVQLETFLDAGVMAPALPGVQYVSLSTCLKYLYILAFTSGKKNAGSDTSHEVEVRAAGQTRVLKLPNRPGNDYLKNKGDLWKLTFDGDLHFTKCVTLANLDHIAIEAGGNDGWNIDSIVTYVGAPGRGFRDATIDFNVYRWVDGNGKFSHRRFMLHNVH